MINNEIKERTLESFPSLQNEDLELLREDLYYKNILKDEVLITPESIDDQLFMILKGFVYISVVDTVGEESVLHIGSKGDLVGSRKAVFMEANKTILNEDKGYYVKALRGTEILVIDSTIFVERLMEESHLVAWFLSMLQRMLGRMVIRMENLLSLTAEERYEKLMREFPHYIQNFPSKHIATFLGITPNSLSRIRARSIKKTNK